MLQVPRSQTEAHSGERNIITGDPLRTAPPLPPSTSLTLPEMLGKEGRTQSQGSPALGVWNPWSGAGRREKGVWVQARGRGGRGGALSPCECGVLS